MKETVLIAGGAGYIGSHTNKRLSQLGYQTVVLDNLTTGHREHCRWGELVLGDLEDLAQLQLVFRQHSISAVLHFAALAYVGESVAQPEAYYHNNVANTLSLLRVMRESGVDKIVFSSSCATYGDPLELPITEAHPQAPISPYGRSKLMVEQILADYAAAYGLSYVSLRYFNAAGADPDGEIGEWHEPETHLVPRVLEVAAGRQASVDIFGTDYQTRDGTAIRDYIHVSDLADAHALALSHLMAGGQNEMLNLGNGAGYSVAEVVTAAEQVTGRPIPVKRSPRRSGDPAALVGSSQKAYEVLGWRPQRASLTQIVESAWRWHLTLH